MKNLKYFFGALLVSAIGFTSCNGDDPVTPTPPPPPPAEVPEVEARAGYVMIVLNTVNEAANPCNGLVFAGNYNGFNTEEAVSFEAIEGYDGWWVAAVSLADLDAGEEYLRGKPNQLNEDGSFPGSWDFQWFAQLDNAGDVINQSEIIQGDAYLNEEFGGEMELRIREGAFDGVVYIRAFAWKRNPCVEPDLFDITFNVTIPEIGADDVVHIVGEINGWDASATPMTRVNATTWTITLEDILFGAQYKYVVNGSWDFEELSTLTEDGCAEGTSNRRVNDRTMNDTVRNFRGITAERCENED